MARLLILPCLVAGGCAAPGPPAGAVVVAVDSDPQSLDPRYGLDAQSSRLGDLLHAGLTRQDATGRRLPEVASSWEFRNPRTVVFRLRTDFRFADGAPLTAADVQATYAAVLDPAVASPRRAALAALAEVAAPDAATVVMSLGEPFAPFLDATGLGILPAARARDRGEVTDGAGPFRLVRFDRGERIVLAPNPWYPDGQPRFDPLIVRIVPDEIVRVLELKRGGVHLVEDPLEPESVAWLRHLPAVRVRRQPGTSFSYLAFNLRDPRLANRRVREAIACAIDREHLIRFVLGSHARPASGLLAPEHWAYVPARLPRHDPWRARRLLDRAGWPDPDGPGPRPRFRIVYKTSTQPARRRLAEAIQAELAEVGIAVEIRTYEWGTLFADIRAGNFELTSLAWVGVGDPDLHYLAFHSSMTPPRGYNRGYYASAVMDRLTARARRTWETAARRSLYGRVQRRVAHDLPVAPLWWEDRIVVQSRRLRGFVPNPSGDLRTLARARTG